MGVIWRRGICGGFYTGFFDSGENGEQSSQTSCSGPHRIFDNQAKFNAEEERGSRRAEEEGKIALRAKRPINTKRE